MAAKKGSGSGKKANKKTSTVVKSNSSKKTKSASENSEVVDSSVPEPTTTPPPTSDLSSSSTSTTTTTTTTSMSDSVLTHQEIEQQFASINEKLSQLRALESSIVSDMKRLQKATTKYVKSLNKKNKKTSGEKKQRAPSGFAKPTEITPELCEFLNVAKGTEMARTEVTKKLTSYIKENGLQDADNKRIIIPDDKLNVLLGNPQEQVTYFNLQKYMKVHFPKKASSSNTTVVL